MSRNFEPCIVYWPILGGNGIQFFTLIVNKQVVRNSVSGVLKFSCMRVIDVSDPQASLTHNACELAGIHTPRP